MELRETLARLRKDHGFSQAELAEELGVTRQAVSRWETGAAAPTTDNLIALSQLFGVTIDELVTGKKPSIAVEVAEPDVVEDAAETGAEVNHRRKHIPFVVGVSILAVYLFFILCGILTNSLAATEVLVNFLTIILVVGSVLCGILIGIISIAKKADSAREDSEAEQSPDSAHPKPQHLKQKIAAVVLVLCLLGGTELWGKLTNSPTSAGIYVLWEIFFMIVAAIITFAWKKFKK